jgi:hypothetical protein
MGKKMYYTEEEAAHRLGISQAELSAYVRDGKLRVFPDGMKKMFRVDQVDELAGGEEVPLLGEADVVSLSEAEGHVAKPKEDSVISSEGISIFDAEDLEIGSADPMAKTQITASIEDQINLEGVGSGSGLLDLTRESDDTSLGAEVLDNIDIEGAASVPAAPVVGGASGSMAGPVGIAPETVMVMPTYVEEIDSSSGLYGGILVGATVVAILLGVAALSSFGSTPPEYLRSIKANIYVVLLGAVVVVAIGAVLGWLAGKASTAQAQALKQTGA